MESKECLSKQRLLLDNIFCKSNSEKYKMAIDNTSKSIVNFLNTRSTACTGVGFMEIDRKVKNIDLEDCQNILSLEDSLLELEDIYFKDAIAFHDIKYMAHLNCPVLIPSLAAEMIISSLNTSMDTWDQSTGATVIEMKLISWTLKEIGYTSLSDGIFTSGGTQSNLMGLLVARNHFIKNNYDINPQKSGLPFEAKKFRIFCSDCSHFSVEKNAGLLGLGQDSVIKVPVDENYRMNLEALENSIKKELRLGNIPVAIVGTAGSTDFGSIDPLEQLAQIARSYKLWYHIDAAYGGGLILSEKHKSELQGIHLSDSVTIDYHKTFLQPISSSAFLVKDSNCIEDIEYYADYLNPKDMESVQAPNTVKKSLQTTRRFDSLKLWISLRILGKQVLGEYIDMIIELARQTSLLLRKNPNFQTLNYPQISAIVFRYAPKDIDQRHLCRINKAIKKTLFNSCGIAVASTKVNGLLYLKFTLLNPMTTIDEISEIIDKIEFVGQKNSKAISIVNVSINTA